MRTALVVHVLAGGLGLVAGFVALSAAKGARLHRRSGMLFVYAMLTMALVGAGIAAWQGTEGSVIGGVLTAYLVTTGLIALRPPAPAERRRRLDVGLMLLALGVGLTSLALGVVTLKSPSGRLHGIPPFAFFLHGVVGVVAGVGDARVLRASRAGGLTGTARLAPQRLARHLWRMGWALWIAAASFFFGQARVIPAPLRVPGLLALPPLAVLLTTAYWLWRVRAGRTRRGAVPALARTPDARPGRATVRA